MPIPVTSGLRLLLDASTISGSDGDLISAWADQSGQGNNATNGSSAAYRPTYKTNIFGANPAVRFGGGDIHMEGSFSSFGAVAGFTCIACMSNLPTEATQVSSAGILAASTTGGNDSGAFLYYVDGYKNDDCYVNGAARLASTLHGVSMGTPSASSQPRCIGFACDGMNSAHIVNGVDWYLTQSFSLPSAPNKYVVGGRYFAGSFQATYGLRADLFYMAFYNARLTNAQIESVTGWMLTQLGVRTASGGGIMSQRRLTGGIA